MLVAGQTLRDDDGLARRIVIALWFLIRSVPVTFFRWVGYDFKTARGIIAGEHLPGSKTDLERQASSWPHSKNASPDNEKPTSFCLPNSVQLSAALGTLRRGSRTRSSDNPPAPFESRLYDQEMDQHSSRHQVHSA